MEFCASAAAKAILFGEHAVVYGQPAIALPLRSLRLQAIVRRSVDGRVRFFSEGNDGQRNEIADEEQNLQLIWQLARASLSENLPPLHFTIRSPIPIASGFGSGAALATAALRACALMMGQRLADGQLNKLVFEVERRFHGQPSGIDNHVIVHERPLFFRSSLAVEYLQLPRALTLIGLRCGIGVPTRVVVADLRRRWQEQTSRVETKLQQIGALTHMARAALLAGDLPRVGELLVQNHRLLRELGLTSKAQDRAVELGQRKGALGAKMSGAGRGGLVLVLAAQGDAGRLARELRREGSEMVFCESVS